MPFKIERSPLTVPPAESGLPTRHETQHHHHHHHTETVVKEVPVLNAQLDTLEVTSLTVHGDLNISNPAAFYPPPPQYVEFDQASSVVGFKVDTEDPFMVYNRATQEVELSAITAVDGTFRSLHTERFTTSVGEFADVLLKKGNVYAPGDIFASGHLIADTAAVGGVIMRNEELLCTSLQSGNIASATLSCQFINTERIRCEAPYITLGGVRLLSGAVDATELHTGAVHAKAGYFDEVECGSLSSLSIRSGIQTPPDSSNVLGCLTAHEGRVKIHGKLEASVVEAKVLDGHEVSTTELRCWGSAMIADVGIQGGAIEASKATLGGVSLSNSSLYAEASFVRHSIVDTHHIKQELNVGEDVKIVDGSVRAADFRLKDGTSILNGVFPPGMIMLFHGKVPPRGWMECNGKGGTPLLASPAAGVIYIVRR